MGLAQGVQSTVKDFTHFLGTKYEKHADVTLYWTNPDGFALAGSGTIKQAPSNLPKITWKKVDVFQLKDFSEDFFCFMKDKQY